MNDNPNTFSFAAVDKEIILASMNNYLKVHKKWMEELKQEAINELKKPYRHWFKTKVRTDEEVQKEIQSAEDNYLDAYGLLDSSFVNPVIKTDWINTGSYYRNKAQELIKLCKLSKDGNIYLNVEDAQFILSNIDRKN